MATFTETITTMTDDLESKRGNSQVKATETIDFSFDGSGPLEIDLSEVNASDLRQRIAEFVEAARPAKKKGGRSNASSGGSKSSGTKSAASSGPRPDNTAKREFWRELANEYDDNDNLVHQGSFPDAVPNYSTRGRIPGTVTELFDKTGGDTSKVSQFVEQTTTAPSTPTPTQPSPVDQAPSAPVGSEDVEERLPEGWKRVDDGTGTGETVVIDEDGFDKTDQEIAQALALEDDQRSGAGV